jgi:polysaccharide chain length determinant protein (PEP-CTERM system associated)
MSQNKPNVQDYIEIILRRKWVLIFTFLLGTTISVAFSYSIPLTYRSSTLILLEPQKIPTAYVSPTITSTVQERLATISQQILSRTNLETIILQFGLYKQEENDGSPLLNVLKQKLKAIANLDLEKILVHFNPRKAAESIPIDVLVERMRRDIEVKVMGGGNAFSVSYVAKEPITAMKVTNTLASLFIEKNLKLREQQAEGTSEFLESQLVEAKGRLQKQEQTLKEFKGMHNGALPGQMESNLRTLDRLQLELQTINEALRNAEERKTSIERLRQELRNIDETSRMMGDAMAAGQLGTNADLPEIRISRLKAELAKLQAEFQDHYPDIILLKKLISEVEGQMGELAVLRTMPSSSTPSLRPIDGNRAQQLSLYTSEILTLNSDIEALKRRREKTGAQIKEHEKRVEATFPNEQTLLNLTRDYDMSQHNYQMLLEKHLNAKISENLEKKQKGEQFRVLDPANIPQKPYKPDRRKIIVLGVLLSGGVGIGLIFFKEYVRLSYRKAEDFHGTIDVPVLGTIPRNNITQGRFRPLITLQEPDSLITEQYRILYTKISQLTKGTPQTIFAISSSIKGEGKTITSLNLALVMARDFGKKVLLIEGDLKNPAIARYLQLKPQTGMIDILLKKADFQSTILTFALENLSVLPVVKSVQNSSSVLSSQELNMLISILKEKYDFILIDCPPILSLPDMNIIEKLVDGILFVVRTERTPRDAVKTAINSLGSDKIVGIILNDAKQASSQYYHYLESTA